MARGRNGSPDDDPTQEGGLAGRGGASASGAGGAGDPNDGLGGSDPAARRDQASDEESPSTPTSTRVAQAAVLLLAVLFGVFALANSQPVDFSWVFGETRVQRDAAGEVASGGAPLIVLLLSSFILGAVLGGWWVWQAHKTRQRRLEDDR